MPNTASRPRLLLKSQPFTFQGPGRREWARHTQGQFGTKALREERHHRMDVSYDAWTSRARPKRSMTRRPREMQQMTGRSRSRRPGGLTINATPVRPRRGLPFGHFCAWGHAHRPGLLCRRTVWVRSIGLCFSSADTERWTAYDLMTCFCLELDTVLLLDDKATEVF